MRSVALFCVVAAVSASACNFSYADSGRNGYSHDPEPNLSTAATLPAACRPRDTGAHQRLYETTEESVHELITCGGLQMRVAASMKLMLFASNEQLLSPSARDGFQSLVALLGLTLDNPFTQEADGSWVMRGIDSRGDPNSVFRLRFYDPATTGVVTVDPFRIDSYLTGVTATSSRTWEEMEASPQAKVDFTFEWTELGPLGHLLSGGGAVPNPIRLRMSLADLESDLLGFAPADYGPFDTTQDIQVDSQIHLVDSRSGVAIAYDVRGLRDSVRAIVTRSAIGLEVESLSATDGTLTLSGKSRDLAFADGGLAGKLQYELSSSILVTSDFGAGSPYPEPYWACR